MSVSKGGRGLKAPYETTHVRVPVPIKDKVQQIIDDYKNGVDTTANDIMEYEQALELAKNILKLKKSARVSLTNLLTGIYGRDITL